jgi:hypothetical protein
MVSAIKLSKKLISAAQKGARESHRSLSSQIEHWAKLGKLVEENSDLTYDFIRDILLSKKEDDARMSEPFEF